MKTESIDLEKIKLFNIVDMGLSFSAMIRLYEKGSKRKIRDKIINVLNKIHCVDSEDRFENYHENFCDWGIQNVILAEKFRNNKVIKKRGPSSYGQIAKTFDVVLKVVIHYCYWPDQKKSKELTKFLHAAIDTKMMLLLEKDYPDYFQYWPKSVEAVDKENYKKLQHLVKKFIGEKHDNKILPVNFDDIYWNILNRQNESNAAESEDSADLQEAFTNTFKKRKSYTRGGTHKRIGFEWWFDETQNSVITENERRKSHVFQFDEILKILQKIKIDFGDCFFPLGNNVEKLTNGTEVRGLGTVIRDLAHGKIRYEKVRHAQGSSYIGPVLEEIGYFEWNGKNRGIKWCLTDFNLDEQELLNRLTRTFS